MYRNWVDIEDLANGYETIQTNFNIHKDTSSKAFKELLSLIDSVKTDLSDKASNNHNNIVNLQSDFNSMQKYLEQSEQKSEILADNFKKMRDDFRGLEVDTEKAISKIVIVATF